MPDKKPYIIIKNFNKYQHYQGSSRPTIWIKLYFKILNSTSFYQLTEFERWIFIGLLLLAGMKNNKILYEKNFLKSKILHYETDIDTNGNKLETAINSLKKEGLIAIKLLSKCYQNASLEKSREEKSREEKSRRFVSSIKNYFINAYKEKFSKRDEKGNVIEETLPVIDYGKDLAVVKGTYESFNSLSEACNLIDDFLASSKAKEFGYTLSICFSSHTVNNWKVNKLKNSNEIS